MRQTLWTKNFTIITLGTVISAIGGVAMSFALGFVVFDTTGSTLATALFTAVSALPRVLLPVLLSPCWELSTCWWGGIWRATPSAWDCIPLFPW